MFSMRSKVVGAAVLVAVGCTAIGRQKAITTISTLTYVTEYGYRISESKKVPENVRTAVRKNLDVVTSGLRLSYEIAKNEGGSEYYWEVVRGSACTLKEVLRVLNGYVPDKVPDTMVKTIDTVGLCRSFN